jgi:hypothetical protein
MATGLEGLLVLNVLFLIAGSGMLWGLRGWSDWGDWVAMSGVAYLMGLGATTVVMTLVLVLGGGVSAAAILIVTLGLGGAGAVAGGLRQRPRPRLGRVWRPRTWADVAACALALGTAVLLWAFFAEARIQPMTDWDAWAFWVAKAKVIYFFGGIGAPDFVTLANPSYPLFVPALDAMDFRFMGSADTTLLAVQYWLLLVGFVVAAAGLLRSLVPQWLVWLFAMTAVVLPQIDHRLLGRTGDWLLDLFFCLSALALVRWMLMDERWALYLFGVMLAATLEIKREGQLLAAVVVLGGIVALGWRRRRAWLPLLGVAALAYVPNIPWRLWWTSRQLAPDTPPGGILYVPHAGAGASSGSFFTSLSHLFSCVRFVLGLLFSFGLWHGAVPIALAAGLVLLTRTNRRVAVFYLVTMCAGVVGWAWVNWAERMVLTPSDSLNPTDRAVGSLALLSVMMTPLLLAGIFDARAERAGPDSSVDPVPAVTAPDVGAGVPTGGPT